MAACPSCGAENPAEARFCRECGNMFSPAAEGGAAAAAAGGAAVGAAAGADAPPPPPPTEPVPPVPPTEAVPGTPPTAAYPAGPPTGAPPPPPPPPGAVPPAPGDEPPGKKKNRGPLIALLALLAAAAVIAGFLVLGGDDDETVSSEFCDGLSTLSEQIADGDDREDQADTVDELADSAEGEEQEDAVAEVADAYDDDGNDQADLAEVVQDELGGFAEDCELDPDEFALAPTTTAPPETTTTTEGEDTTTTTEGEETTTTTIILGTGDVQVTLEWDSDADLDLAVTDPTGETIDFGNSGPTATGGELDVDSNVGCEDEGSVENIFWPPGQAPAGEYTASVTGFSTEGCAQGAQDGDFVLTIRVAGSPDQEIPGTVAEGETLDFPFSVA